MKRTIALLSMLISPAVFAQPGVSRPSSLANLSFGLERLEALQRERAAAIRRDAFIVSQLVVSTASLDDFQRNAALQKAREAIDAAQRRARENPQASIYTATALSKVFDLVKQAQQQGASADIPTLKRDILRQTHFIQQELFKELQESRADRQALTDLQARLSRMTTDLDQALGEALGATFDFFRAGGQ
ncbi:MAG: hypothetical protein AABO58_24970 [Acidobacteriota bacterium]